SDVTTLTRDGGFDLEGLAGPAAELLYQLDSAQLATDGTWGTFGFNQMTPVGRIAIRGIGDDTWGPADADTAGDLALIVDAGGDDTYIVPTATNTSLTQPFAIHLDLGGADTYTYQV